MTLSGRYLALARILVGLTQGLLLYWLFRSFDERQWSHNDLIQFQPKVFMTVLLPVMALTGLNHMRPKILCCWLICAAFIIGLLAYYEATLDVFDFTNQNDAFWDTLFTTPLPLVLICGIFIAHVLILSAEEDGQKIARYPTYFDQSWKGALQIILSGGFVLIFWIILWLGEDLFKLIGLPFFHDLIRHAWFSVPATALAFSAAIHITDVNVKLVKGFRTLKLALLSWLLPLITLIVMGFLLSLPFQGLGSLWATHHTTQLILGVMAWLILLINASYQDGLMEHRPSRFIQISARCAAIALLPLALITFVSLEMRISQHGCSVNMIYVAAALLVASLYTAGYLWAALEFKSWLKRVEMTNVMTSFAILAILLALMTPLADPMRLSVASQIHLLASGKIDTKNFDYNYLRQHGGPYGTEALMSLRLPSSSPDAEIINHKIDIALKLVNRYGATNTEQSQSSDLRSRIDIYPREKLLPDSFFKTEWKKVLASPTSWMLPLCLMNTKSRCEAYIVEATETTPLRVILEQPPINTYTSLFEETKDGWTFLGSITMTTPCKEDIEELEKGHFSLVPQPTQTLVVNGRTYFFEHTHQFDGCHKVGAPMK